MWCSVKTPVYGNAPYDAKLFDYWLNSVISYIGFKHTIIVTPIVYLCLPPKGYPYILGKRICAP